MKQLSHVHYLLVILGLAAFLEFWKLGEHPLEEWDEARYGFNALEMIARGDYVNYYFNGLPDTWVAKPPLLMWSIVLSYKLFGYNEFALRLPSALAILGFFIYFFSFVRLFRPALYAFVASLILMSVKGIIGFHVGRTGDMDAMLLLFLMGFVYHFIQYWEFGKKGHIWLSAIMLGLAFYVKGTTSVFYIPALFIYLILTRRFLEALKDYRIWLTIGIYGLFIFSWYLLIQLEGQTFTNTEYLGKNAWETMWLYDTFFRFTEPTGADMMDPRYSFFITTMDIMFNVWNNIFWIALVFGIYMLIRKKIAISEWLTDSYNRPLLLSGAIIFIIGLILTFSQSKLTWYIAPAVPFIAIIVTEFIFYTSQKVRFLKWAFGGLLLFLLVRNFIYLNSVEYTAGTFIKKHKAVLQSASAVSLYDIGRQDLLLYINWYNPHVRSFYNMGPPPEILKENEVILGRFIPGKPDPVAPAGTKMDHFKDHYIIYNN